MNVRMCLVVAKVIIVICYFFCLLLSFLFFTDTCQGDSDGPLMMFTLSNQRVLVGLTSNGIRCAQANYIGLYTRVAAFENWLRSHVNNSFSVPINSTAPSIHPPKRCNCNNHLDLG